MRRKKKKKLIESLFSFYHIVASIYNDSEKYEDDSTKGLMIEAHLTYLFDFHKDIATSNKLDIPEKMKFFEKYIEKWNAHIKTKEPELTDVLLEYSGKKSRSYVI